MGRSKKSHKKSSKKKKQAQIPQEGETEGPKIPKSFVFRRGRTARVIVQLEQDLRRVMSPHTALRLKESGKNQMKDFLNVAPVYNVTHFLALSQTDYGTNLRIMRIPRGPTLTFRVLEYSLMKDVAAGQKRPHSPGAEFLHSPLVVLNNFSSPEAHMKLMATMFQNMFPAIDVKTIRLAECRRVVLLNYDAATQTIDFRHYLVTASPVGLSKSIKKLIKAKIPDLSKLQDISEYVFKDEHLSDSEAEDAPEAQVQLSQNFVGRGNRKNAKSAIRLKEMGPRMTLKLIKIEEEFCTGKVLYHSFIQRSEEEVEELQQKKETREKLKAERKAQQEANVKRKQDEKEQKQKIKQARKAAKSQNLDGEEKEVDADIEDDESEEESAPAQTVEDDDADWYRLEVGAEPEVGLFDKKPRHQEEASSESKDKGKGAKRKFSSNKGKSASSKPSSLKKQRR